MNKSQELLSLVEADVETWKELQVKYLVPIRDRILALKKERKNTKDKEKAALLHRKIVTAYAELDKKQDQLHKQWKSSQDK